MDQRFNGSEQKIEVFEESQYADVRDDTYDQPGFSRFSGAACDLQTGQVINHDHTPQDENVFGHECHVEITAGCQQQTNPHPLIPQLIITKRYYHEKNKELQRNE